MPLSESDTRAKLIDPALHVREWTEDLIRREETAGAVEIVYGQPRKWSNERTNYTHIVKVTREAQPVAVALIEAKAENLPPGHGMEQAKLYAESKRLNVPFVIATNGYQFVMYDRITGITSNARPMAEIPTPAELRASHGSKCKEPLVTGRLVEWVTWDYIMGLITNPVQFEQKLRHAQAQEAATMQPKQKELEHILALLSETEKEADEIARANRKAKGIIAAKLAQQANEVNRRYQVFTTRMIELKEALAIELTDRNEESLLEIRDVVATGLQRPTPAT